MELPADVIDNVVEVVHKILIRLMLRIFLVRRRSRFNGRSAETPKTIKEREELEKVYFSTIALEGEVGENGGKVHKILKKIDFQRLRLRVQCLF